MTIPWVLGSFFPRFFSKPRIPKETVALLVVVGLDLRWQLMCAFQACLEGIQCYYEVTEQKAGRFPHAWTVTAICSLDDFSCSRSSPVGCRLWCPQGSRLDSTLPAGWSNQNQCKVRNKNINRIIYLSI